MLDEKQRSELLEQLVHSPSYRVAYRDADLMDSPDLRHVRMLLEFLKPDLILRRHHVESTIVVFGGTQVTEPASAQKRLDQARQRLAVTPDDPRRRRDVARVERIAAKSSYYDVAREFARLVSSQNQVEGRCEYVITTGGGPGIMEAANRGAHDVGAKSIGLNIRLPREQEPNPYITPELCFQFHYFAIRKLHFLLRAKALVIFPGGYGTLDEMFDALTLRQTGRMQDLPIILFGRKFWERTINFQFLADEGTIEDRDLDLIHYVDEPEQAWQIIQDFHKK
ncbi:MAG TPA: 3-isopropylmalate dehydrogenase [Planctomycetaceae bacterium]|nr:3-isopropylmalate dehydrogenase [Planctomycetaceae bacterium]